MKTVVALFGIFGAAMCYPWGQPQQVLDTPEVAAAKAAHLAAHAKARYASPNLWAAESRSWNGPEDDGSWTEGKYDSNDGSWKGNDGSWQDSNGAWQGNDGEDGSWRDDTHSWNQGGAHWESHEKKWTGPVALPPGYDKNGAPLQVLDTPEVAAAKAAHLAALATRRY